MKKERKVFRFIVIHRESGRIVAKCGGTHSMMYRICERLDNSRTHAGTYMYDDECEAYRYLPQVGPNVSLSVR